MSSNPCSSSTAVNSCSSSTAVNSCSSSTAASDFSLIGELPDELKAEALSHLSPQELQQFSLASRDCNQLANDAMCIKFRQLEQYLVPRLPSEPLSQEYEKLQKAGNKHWRPIKTFLLNALELLPNAELGPLTAAASVQFPHFRFLARIHASFLQITQLPPAPNPNTSEKDKYVVRLRKICEELTAIGLFVKALEITRIIPCKHSMTYLLEHIIQELPDLQKIDQILKLARKSLFPSSSSLSQVLHHAAVKCAVHKELDRAIKITMSISKGVAKAEALEKIAATALTDTQIETFLKMAFALSTIDDRALALSGFVKRYLQCGQMDSAFALLDKMEPSHIKAILLREITEKAPHVKYVERARSHLAEMANSQYTADFILANSVADFILAVSNAFVSFDQIDQALDVLESNPIEVTQQVQPYFIALEMIAKNLSDQKSLARAEELYHRGATLFIDDFYSYDFAYRHKALAALIRKHMALGNFLRAVELIGSSPSTNAQKMELLDTLILQAQSIDFLTHLHSQAKECRAPNYNGLLSSKVFEKIAKKYADFGNVEEALNALDAITHTRTKGTALRYIASRVTTSEQLAEIEHYVLKTGGDLSVTIKMRAAFGQLEKALQIAIAIPQKAQKFHAITNIARGQPHREGLERVHAFAAPLPAEQRECLLWGIAEKEADTGDWTRAIEIASSLQIEYPKSRAFAFIAEKYADQGQYDQALLLIPSISDKGLQIETLKHIAASFANAGLIEKALEIIPLLPENHRGVPLSHIASQLPNLESMDSILSLLQTVQSKEDQERAFQDIAAKFAECGAIDTALQLIKGLSDPMNKGEGMEKIIRALCKIKHFDEALNVYQLTDHFAFIDQEKRFGMEIISKSLADDGQFKKAEEVAYALHALGASSSQTANCFQYIHKLQAKNPASIRNTNETYSTSAAQRNP